MTPITFRTNIDAVIVDRRDKGVEGSHYVERTGDGGEAFFETHYEAGPECPCAYCQQNEAGVFD